MSHWTRTPVKSKAKTSKSSTKHGHSHRSAIDRERQSEHPSKGSDISVVRDAMVSASAGERIVADVRSLDTGVTLAESVSQLAVDELQADGTSTDYEAGQGDQAQDEVGTDYTDPRAVSRPPRPARTVSFGTATVTEVSDTHYPSPSASGKSAALSFLTGAPMSKLRKVPRRGTSESRKEAKKHKVPVETAKLSRRRPSELSLVPLSAMRSSVVTYDTVSEADCEGEQAASSGDQDETDDHPPLPTAQASHSNHSGVATSPTNSPAQFNDSIRLTSAPPSTTSSYATYQRPAWTYTATAQGTTAFGPNKIGPVSYSTWNLQEWRTPHADRSGYPTYGTGPE